MVDRTHPAGAMDAHPHAFSTRKWLFRVCATVGLLLVVFGNVAVWAQRTVFNTDQFVSTVSPALDQPEARDAAANRLATELTERAELQTRISQQLPSGLAFLAPPITASAHDLIATAVLRAMDRPSVRDARDPALRLLHDRFIRLIENRAGALETDNGVLYLDLRPVLQQAVDDIGLQGQGQLVNNVNLPPDAGRIEIGQARSAYTWLGFIARYHRGIGIGLVLLPAALFALAIAFGRDRRRAVFFSGVLVAAGGVFSLLLLLPLRAFIVGQARNPDVARSTFRILMESYRLQSLIVVLIGAAVALAALFLGRSAAQRHDMLTHAVTKHGAALRLVAFAATVVLLVTWPAPDWRFYVALFGSLVLALGAIQVFASDAKWSASVRSRLKAARDAVTAPPPGEAGSAGWTRVHTNGLHAAGLIVFVALALLWPSLTWAGLILLVVAAFAFYAAVDWLGRDKAEARG